MSDRNAAGRRPARHRSHRRGSETEMGINLIGLGAEFNAFLFLFAPFALEICEDMGEMRI